MRVLRQRGRLDGTNRESSDHIKVRKSSLEWVPVVAESCRQPTHTRVLPSGDEGIYSMLLHLEYDKRLVIVTVVIGPESARDFSEVAFATKPHRQLSCIMGTELPYVPKLSKINYAWYPWQSISSRIKIFPLGSSSECNTSKVSFRISCNMFLGISFSHFPKEDVFGTCGFWN